MNAKVMLLLGQFLVATTLTAPLATSISIGPATITLEESTFASVAKQLGDAPTRASSMSAVGFAFDTCGSAWRRSALDSSARPNT